MAYEQNPYAIKISLVPDASAATAVAGQRVAIGIPFTAQQLTGGQNPLFTASATAASAAAGVSGTYTLAAAVTATANPIAVNSTVNLEGFSAPYSGSLVVSATGGSASAWTFTATLLSTATGNPATSSGVVRTLNSGGLSTYSYNESGNVASPITASTQRPIGVLQNQPYVWYDANSNIEGVSEAEITVSGVTKMVAGGVVVPGNPVTVDASGRATAYTFPTTAPSAQSAVAGQFVIGTALSAGVANDIITVALACHNAVRGA